MHANFEIREWGINGRRAKMPIHVSCLNKTNRDHFISDYANLISINPVLKIRREGTLKDYKQNKTKPPIVFYHVFEIEDILFRIFNTNLLYFN